MRKDYHLDRLPIPAGFQIFDDRLEVKGVYQRKADASAFARAGNPWLELQRDPGNAHDPNAIRVIGCTRGWLFTRRRHIGYVDRVIARVLAESGLAERVRPRLLKTYVGDGGYVEILYQLLGPKGEKQAYLHHFTAAA